MSTIILSEESYKIVGLCMEVHNRLGMGFPELIYKDALEIEFSDNSILFEREKPFRIEYKDRVLRKKFAPDFVLFDKIILEVKARSGIIDDFLAQTLNYLKASKLNLGILVNFGEPTPTFKRVVF